MQDREASRPLGAGDEPLASVNAASRRGSSRRGVFSALGSEPAPGAGFGHRAKQERIVTGRRSGA